MPVPFVMSKLMLANQNIFEKVYYLDRDQPFNTFYYFCDVKKNSPKTEVFGFKKAFSDEKKNTHFCNRTGGLRISANTHAICKVILQGMR